MSLAIPTEFMKVEYDFDRHPQSATFTFDRGANCQLWAYAILEHFGVRMPPFRSSNLWEDEEATFVVDTFSPLDILLFNHTENPWGAHVAVYLGNNQVAHLSKKNRYPQIATIEAMMRLPEYRVLIGAKRVKEPNQSFESTAQATVAT